MRDRLLLLACPLLVAVSLIACGQSEPAATETAANEPAAAETEAKKPVYNAVAPSAPEVFDDGVRVLLDAPLINGLVLPFDYSVLSQEASNDGGIRVVITEMEIFAADEAEAVAQLEEKLLADGFKILNNRGTQGKLIRFYSRGGRTVYDGAETINVVAHAYPGEKSISNPAAKARLIFTVSTAQ